MAEVAVLVPKDKQGAVLAVAYMGTSGSFLLSVDPMVEGQAVPPIPA